MVWQALQHRWRACGWLAIAPFHGCAACRGRRDRRQCGYGGASNRSAGRAGERVNAGERGSPHAQHACHRPFPSVTPPQPLCACTVVLQHASLPNLLPTPKLASCPKACFLPPPLSAFPCSPLSAFPMFTQVSQHGPLAPTCHVAPLCLPPCPLCLPPGPRVSAAWPPVSATWPPVSVCLCRSERGAWLVQSLRPLRHGLPPPRRQL